MDATSSETTAHFQRTTRRYIPEDRTLHNHRCENLRSCNEAVSTPDYIASDSRVIYVLWHADPLLGNDHEISKYTTAVNE
jgi:hypothetical protein